MRIAYCTNLRPAPSLASLGEDLRGFWSVVRGALEAELGAHGALGVGLWLPRGLATQLAEDRRSAEELRATLASGRLRCETLNAFPYESFHTPIVREAVYRPSWLEPARLGYTLEAATALARLLPDDAREGTISTVPFGWRLDVAGVGAGLRLGEALHALLRGLAAVEAETGRRVRVLFEPEPGCVAGTIDEGLDLLEPLFGGERGDAARRYLGLCLDVCHEAVLGQDPAASLRRAHRKGIPVAKIHLSAALEGPLAELAPFAERRYLHQTVVVGENGGPDTYVDDLATALAEPAWRGRRARTHFHVPIAAAPGGALESTSHLLGAVVDAALELPELPLLEVETYTYAVLPVPPASTAEAVAEELRHAHRLVAERRARPT